MKSKLFAVIFAFLMCVGMVACGGGEEAKRPIDYPNTKWQCTNASFTFSVTEDCKIEDAVITNSSGEEVSVTVEFSEQSEGKMYVKSANGAETYFSGTCTFGKNKFTVMVSDVHDDFSHLPIKLIFKA